MLQKLIEKIEKLGEKTGKVTAWVEKQLWLQSLMNQVLGSGTLNSLNARIITLRLLTITTLIILLGLIYGTYIQSEHRLGWVFREGKPGTWTSFFMLIMIAYLFDKAWNITCESKQVKLNHPSSLWWFLSWGFYLAAWDELLRLHETLDRTIHKIFLIKETPLTDHLDDLFVGLYGVVGVIILYHYRKEIRGYIAAGRYFFAAVICGIASVAFDFLCSSRPVLRKFFSEEAEVQLAINILDVVEECFKIYAEVFFVSVAFTIYQQLKSRTKLN